MSSDQTAPSTRAAPSAMGEGPGTETAMTAPGPSPVELPPVELPPVELQAPGPWDKVDLTLLKRHLRIADNADDDILTGSLLAAQASIDDRCTIPTPAPANAVTAALLLAARYFARRNSPEGVLGFSDFGVARITTVDRDVEALISRWRKPAFA